MLNKRMGRVVTFYNEKGGVGKTTDTVQSALELSYRNFKVLIIDNEMQGHSVTSLLDKQHLPVEISEGESNTANLYASDKVVAPYMIRENLYIFGSDDRLTPFNSNLDSRVVDNFLSAVERFTQEFDYILLDCSPTYGVLSLTAVEASASGGVVIPAKLDELSLEQSEKTIDHINRFNKRAKTPTPILGILLNEVQVPLTSNARKCCDRFQELFDGLLFENVIQKSTNISNALYIKGAVRDLGKSKRVVQTAQEISDFVDEMIQRIEQAKKVGV